MTDLTLPPNAGDFERAVLGSLMLDPLMFGEINKIIKTPSAFYEHKHGWIYAAIAKIAKRKENVDLLTVSMQLAKDNLLHECGGESYLAELVNTIPTALSIVTYANEVAEKYISRKLFLMAQEMSRLAYENADVDAKRIKAKALMNTALEGAEKNARLSWRETVDEALIGLYEGVWGDAPGEMFTTGISELDTVLDESLMLGKMIIVAAKPKRGKSTLMRSIALTNAKLDKPIAIFSYEEREHNIAKTMLAREARSTVSTMALRRMVKTEGRDEEAATIYNNLIQKANELKRLPIEVVYASGWTVEDAVMEMERLRDVNGTRLFVMDYAQRVRASNPKLDRRLQLAHIGQSIANAAHDLNVTILLGSQVNDDGRTREAEDLENEMDVKILIEADDTSVALGQAGKSVPVTLKVMLNRNGPSGDVAAAYNGAHRLFMAADTIKLPSIK